MSESEKFDAAQKKLDQAVLDFLAETGWNEGGVMTAWVLVGHQAWFDDEGREMSALPLAYMHGSIPDHTAIGLLEMAKDCIRGVGNWGRVAE